MAEKKNTADIAKLSFEEALHELEQIVRRLESGETSLDQAIDDYARGSYLKAHCEKKLQDARLKVEKIIHQSGEIATQPLDA
ncbi:exodeoxyribonuclease VII small subunit [bacterium]|nr:exodeoxyribonuclease VII small subunit [bacterium]